MSKPVVVLEACVALVTLAQLSQATGQSIRTLEIAAEKGEFKIVRPHKSGRRYVGAEAARAYIRKLGGE